MPQEARLTTKKLQSLAVSTLRTMIPEMSKHGKFNKFLKLVKGENIWTNILKQHKEASLKNPNLSAEDDKLELDSLFVSLDNEEKHIHTKDLKSDKSVKYLTFNF